MDRIDLGGRWEVRRATGGGTMPATVPGCVHTDLLALGKIPDPFVRDNELGVQWVGESGWVYTRTFDVPAGIAARRRLLLRCEGLDTFAAVSVNGRTVGSGDNMFRTYEFDVKGAVAPGANTVAVAFRSVLPYVRRKQKERPLAPAGVSVPHETPGRGYVRKQPCNFGWDWGPVLVTCGIWRPIGLLAFDAGRLTDVAVRQDHRRKGRVGLAVAVEADAEGLRDPAVSVSVSFEGNVLGERRIALRGGRGEAAFDIAEPRLWWPRGMGGQPLYTVRAVLLDGGSSVDEAVRRIGLRTLRLDRRPDRWGESFRFAANGVPFFAKGGNWIPADAFVTRVSRERYRDLVGSCADANMNMLRVWGGGVYEHDDFYDACDEAGVCVWQEFMFACAAYPARDAAFLRSVEAEARDNVRRLRHHPCVAVYCGNNELEMCGFVGRGPGLMKPREYERLFDRLLPDVVRDLDPERDYWPSSSHTPGLEGDARYRDANNPGSGDAHLWSVWHGRQPFEWYRTCTHRFNSEFGFQSFPEPRTVRAYTAPGDRNVTARVMEHHQRSGIGNTTIMTYMLDWFRLPHGFENTLRLSQILQGMAMKYAVEHWRRAMPRGMGTLYWQINDNWPVASWSSIDYFGRWKALHYMARRFYAPVLLSAVEDASTGRVDLFLTNDGGGRVEGVVRWTLTDLSGALVAGGELPAAAPARTSRKTGTLRLASYIAGRGARNLLLWLELEAAGRPPAANLVHFARPKHLDLEKPSLRADVRREGGVFTATIAAAKPALWVWLELEGTDARFSDNFIHVRPGVPAEIRIVPARPMTLDEVRAELRLRSLADTWEEAA